MPRSRAVVLLAAAWGIGTIMATTATAQPEILREYVDQARRFRFSYPVAFGEPSAGTNDGFEDRVAAVRFSVFSAGLGGELALTRGLPVIDLQAIGGLYDAIALEVFPGPLRRVIVTALPPLTLATFCQALGREQHLDPETAALSALTAQQRAAVASVDRMRNVNPRVLQCVANGATITFDKEAAFQPSAPPQHIYGAVRFLESPYSTVQIVRAGPPPDPVTLTQMAAVVRSWSRF